LESACRNEQEAKTMLNLRANAAVMIATSLAVLSAGAASHAQATAPTSTPPAAPQLTPAEARAGYALPWTMRPAIAPNLLRIESSIGFRNDGVAAATLLTGGYAVLPTTLGFYARLGVTNSVLSTPNAPTTNNIATGAVTNPLLMALFTPELTKGLRLTVFGAATIPVGTGGGNTPSALTASSIATGIPTRSAMDNALFAVNYFTPIVGLGAAFIRWGWTFQAEATVLQLIRVRGENHRSATDDMRTNFTVGASVGYLIHRYVTASAEFHYQHWLSAPNLLNPPAPALAPSVNQASFEVGVRTNLPFSRTILARPGIAFGMGFNGAMAEREYKVLHVDFPITF
jgi:hypothetical protein